MDILDTTASVLRIFQMSRGRRLDVEVEDAAQCVVQGDRRRVVVDRRRKLIEAGASRHACAAVDAVLIRQRSDADDDGNEPFWSVALRLRTGGQLDVGSSHNDVDASIAAAALGRSIGCAVQRA